MERDPDQMPSSVASDLSLHYASYLFGDLQTKMGKKKKDVSYLPLKVPYSTKIDIIQKRFNKLILNKYAINTIIKCGN